MQIDRVIYPVESLGPGKRLILWTVGCSNRCPHCSNPELWAANPIREIAVPALLDAIKVQLARQPVDGITITGGDPMQQFDDLLALLEGLKPLCDDILVYTGYTLQELDARCSKQQQAQMRRLVGVLIDGQYIHAQNDPDCVLRGSRNQKIWYFEKALQPRYQTYLARGRQLQNVFYANKAISIGIHNKE